MADPAATPDPGEQVAQAVADLMPALRSTSRTALFIILGAVALSAAIIAMLLSAGSDGDTGFSIALGVLAAGFVVVVAAWKWAIATQEERVMPVLARAVGLRYGKNAKDFVAGLPRRLLPDRSDRSGEDHIIGQLGVHRIEMAEVTAETGGKNSRVLFKGIVARFPNRTAMPAFFIARQDATAPGFFSASQLSTEGLHPLRKVQIGRHSYGIWTSWTEGPEPPALSAVIDVLCQLNTHVGPDVGLYAATSNGEETHVALTHKRNLFRIGGLFPSKAKILADVQTALQDLTVPLALAQALIQAEEAALEKVKGA